MVIRKKIILIIILSTITAIYGFFLTNYFISISTVSDITYYISLWEELESFRINSFNQICCEFNSLMFITRREIGSFQFIYPLIVNYLSKIMSFQFFTSFTSGIYSFLITFIFLFNSNFVFRLFFIFPIFYSIYTFGLYSVLDRLKVALIFYLIASIPTLGKKVRNFMLFFSILTHSSIALIAIPTFVKINFKPRLSPLIRNISSKFKILNILKLRLKSIFFAFIGLLFSALIIYLSYEKVIAWIPFIINFRDYNNYFISLDRFIDVFFIFVLMYPNFKNKQYPRFIHLLSNLPILMITILIGGFRTLILSYIYFAVSNWYPAKKSKLSYLQTLFFIALTINCMRNASLFITKLQLTGFGY